MKRNTVNLHDFVKLPLFLLGLTCIRLKRFGCEKNTILRLVFIGVIIVFNVTFLSAYMFLGDMSSIFVVVAFIVFCGFSFNALLKGYAVLIARKKLGTLLNNLQELYPKDKKSFEEFCTDDYYATISRYSKTLTSIHMTTTTMFNLFPLMQSLVEYIFGWSEQFHYRFPYILWYPFNEEQPFNFMIAYSSQILGSYVASCLSLGSDLLLISLMHILNMNFDYLGRRINEFQLTGTDADLKDLKECLAFHAKILNYADIVDSVYGVSLLVTYFGYCGLLCLIGLQVVAGADVPTLITFLAFLIATMSHVLLISYVGGKLIDLSESISNVMCHHAWYSANLKYMKMLYMPIARAQRPAAITACGYFNISMESFKTVLTTSYQFFTLLRTSLYE